MHFIFTEEYGFELVVFRTKAEAEIEIKRLRHWLAYTNAEFSILRISAIELAACCDEVT